MHPCRSGTIRRSPPLRWMKEPSRWGLYDPYAQGHTRVAMAGTMRCNVERRRQPLNPVSVRIADCKRPREYGMRSKDVSLWRPEFSPGACTHRPSLDPRWEGMRRGYHWPWRVFSRWGARSRNKVPVAEAAGGSPPKNVSDRDFPGLDIIFILIKVNMTFFNLNSIDKHI